MGPAIYGKPLGRSGGLYGIVTALLPAQFFGELLICDTGNIAPVNVAVEGGRTDRPLTTALFRVDDDIYRNTCSDQLGSIPCVVVVLTQLDFHTLGGGLEVCVILCDLCGVVIWAAGGFCTHMRIQAMLDFSIYGGYGEAAMER